MLRLFPFTLLLAALTALPLAANQQLPLTAAVRTVHERPQLLVNEEPVLPLFYALTDSPGGRWTWEEIPQYNIGQFAQHGVRLFSVSIWLEWIWSAPDTLNLDLVRRQVRGILDVCPEAAVLIRLHVNSPPWWNERHPEELVHFADGPVDTIAPWGLVRPLEGDLERTARHSMASQRWREESGAIVARLCRELAGTPEGAHVMAFHLAAGVFHEWHYYGFLDHEPDTGPAMTAYFRHWLRTKYGDDSRLRAAWRDPLVAIDTATVPGLAERRQTSDGWFRDPARERRVLDYFECHQLSVEESIEHFCRTVKENWPRPVVTGAFYGYYFTLFGRFAVGGHLEAERLLASPWIDYLSGPQSYRHRDMGRAGISRGLLESVRLHGKLWLDEYDTAPSFRGPADPKSTDHLRYMVGLERRNVLEPLLRGHGLWLYDFGLRFGRGYWDHPLLLQQVAEVRDLFQQRLQEDFRSAADVLLVLDTASLYDVGSNSETSPVAPVAIDDFTEDLFHTGAGVDMIYLADLDRIDLAPYRLVIFPNAYRLTPAQRALIRDRVATGGRHLLWMSAPGYSDGERLDPALIGDATGIDVRRAAPGTSAQVNVNAPALTPRAYGLAPTVVQPLFASSDPAAEILGTLGEAGGGLVRKRLAAHTAWFTSVPLRSADLIREILRQAGVHLYQDAGDVTYAGNGMVCLHSVAGGRRRVALRNGRTVDLELEPWSTLLLDADTGRTLLSTPDFAVPRTARN